jgi:hypothetical protein
MIIRFLAIAIASSCALAQPPLERTCFQSYAPYSPALDIGSDLAIVYGVDATFNDRVRVWREKGYNVGMMTGISWGAYDAYYGTGDAFKKAEVQTRKDGSLYMHGGGVGYNVPTDAYVEFIKQYIAPAVDAGVTGIFMEEPEFWANTGWSEAFKKLWQERYGEAWVEPDSSVDAQYKASRLKYELYFDALKKVFAFAKGRAKAQGRTIDCIVPTHSMINYAQWRIVSPESHLIDIPELDGYVAQVWTGTARSHNRYQGVAKERTFETAYLEFGQMTAMVKPTGKKVWFLADPVEDNPNHSWNDYKKNYECTIAASLMWPEVSRYEVMPWPDRIFQGTYPKIDMDAKSGTREGIPAEYATELLTVINALNDMEQPQVVRKPGDIGIVVSDTLMFQRANPSPSDPTLANFYGLALPLLKAGVTVHMLQLENTLQANCFDGFKILLLTYEGQKPLKPEYHDALASWTKSGGALILVDDGMDPYHHVREWWNDNAKNNNKAYDDLLHRLGATPTNDVQKIGAGYFRHVASSPSTWTGESDGERHVRDAVNEIAAKIGMGLEYGNNIRVDRGPYVIAAVMNESVSEEPLLLKGTYIDLFDAELPVLQEKKVEPDQRAFLYNVEWAWKTAPSGCKVLAAAARIRSESYVAKSSAGTARFTFLARGPLGTSARARVLLPAEPISVECTLPGGDVSRQWDGTSSTLLLSFPNVAADVRFTIELP